MVFQHPFDTRYVSPAHQWFYHVQLKTYDCLKAFVLTKGKTHYRTEDRGKSWRSFNLPIPPSYTANPLSFHSDPAKYGYILYQGTNCDRQGWGAICHDEVSNSFSMWSAA
jgi:hypothetical protein